MNKMKGSGSVSFPFVLLSLPNIINVEMDIFRRHKFYKELANHPKLEYIKELGRVIGFSGIWMVFNVGDAFNDDKKESNFGGIFAYRLGLGKISYDDKKKQQYLKDKDLQDILKYYGLDPLKFWWLALFIVDYIDDMYTSSTIRDELQLFIDKAEQMTDKGMLSLKIDNKSVKIEHTDTIRVMAHTLKAYIENHKPDSLFPYYDEESRELDVPLDDAQYNKLSDTYKAFYFELLFSIFLRDKNKVNDTGKRSKKELIAKMAYILEIVSNRDALESIKADGTLNNYIKGIDKTREVKHIIYKKFPDQFLGDRITELLPLKKL
ncbi:MAG: hypothetical protein SPL96_00355 [Bacteroidales bacterium]|nr:hypothetical protein [Bacteroidales bacterium]